MSAPGKSVVRALIEQHIPEGQGAEREPAAGVCAAEESGTQGSACSENLLPMEL